MTIIHEKAEKFEKLVASFFSKINSYKDFKAQHNVKVESPDGPRQIDVMLEGKLGLLDVRVIIECKDYKGKVSVEKIDALHSKKMDVNAHMAVLVSAKGFSGTAKKKAKRLGIELCTFTEALSEHWKPKLDLPIVLKEILPIFNYSFSYGLDVESGINIENMTINGHNIYQDFFKEWAREEFEIRPYSSEEIIKMLHLHPPYRTENKLSKNPILLDNLKIELIYRNRYFYGNLSRLENTLILDQVTSNKKEILIDGEKLLNYENIFAIYNSLEDIPNFESAIATCIVKTFDFRGPDRVSLSGTPGAKLDFHHKGVRKHLQF